MVGWHHQLNGHEFEQALGDGQGSLAFCSPWGCKKLNMTERLNNNNTSNEISEMECEKKKLPSKITPKKTLGIKLTNEVKHIC